MVYNLKSDESFYKWQAKEQELEFTMRVGNLFANLDIDDFDLLNDGLTMEQLELKTSDYAGKKDDIEYCKLYTDLTSGKKSNSWNLERLNDSYYNYLLDKDELKDLYNFDRYLAYAMEWLPQNSPLYRDTKHKGLYYTRLFNRQFKAMAEFKALEMLQKHYPSCKVARNLILDTVFGIDMIVSFKGKQAYIHVAEQGQGKAISNKIHNVGAIRSADGTQFKSFKTLRKEIATSKNHKTLYYSLSENGFVFDEYQFSNLLDTDIDFKSYILIQHCVNFIVKYVYHKFYDIYDRLKFVPIKEIKL